MRKCVSLLLLAFLFILSCAEPGIIQGRSDKPLRIVTWNIEFLGGQAREVRRTDEQILAIADRIKGFNAAVIALQEIADISVLKKIQKAMGSSWEIYHPITEKSLPDAIKESMTKWGANALLYDTAKVEILSAEMLLRLSEPTQAKYPGVDFRSPVSGVFCPVGQRGKIFRVISVHCHWQDSLVRKKEGVWLRTKVQELLGTKGESRDIILLGDFNGEPPDSPHMSLQQERRLSLLAKENGNVTCFRGINIDHIYVTVSLKPSLRKPSSYVIRPEYFGETHKQFEATYSDHFPVYVDVLY